MDLGVKSGGISNKVHGMLTMHSKPRSDQCLFFWALMRTRCAPIISLWYFLCGGTGCSEPEFQQGGKWGWGCCSG